MNAFRALPIVVLFLSSSAFAKSVTISFSDLNKMVENKNPQVMASKLEAEAAQKRTSYFLRSFLPSAEVFGSQENFTEGTGDSKSQPAFGAEVRVNLLNGGRDLAENNIRDLQGQKSEFELKRIFSEELQKARVLFWEILFSQENLELLINAQAINEQNLQSAKSRIQNGVATESDRMEFEMKSVELKMEMEELKTKLMTQKKELALALNLEPSAQIELNGKLEHAHDFESGLKHSPKDHEHLIKPSELEADSLDQMATKESRAWFPKLDAYASYNQFNQLENDSIDAKDRTESILGLRLSMSLPGGFESSTESSAKAREAQARRIMAEQRKKEISAHVENEIEELRMKHAQVHDAEENITRAEKYYKLTMSEYSRGAKNSPDALGASEKLLSVRQKKIEIVRDFQVLTAHLLSKIGK